MGAAESRNELAKGASYEGDVLQDQDPLALLLGGLGLGAAPQETREMGPERSDQRMSFGTTDLDFDFRSPERVRAPVHASCVHVELSPAMQLMLDRQEEKSVKSAGQDNRSVVSGSSSREERQSQRLQASRDRSRSRSRSRSRVRGSSSVTSGFTPSSYASSGRYLSDDEEEEADGLVAIQCALESEAYRDKIDMRFHNLRNKKDQEWGIHGRQGDIATFYNKREGQNIREVERSLIGAIKRSDDIAGHSKNTRKKNDASFWSPYSGTLFSARQGAWSSGAFVS